MKYILILVILSSVACGQQYDATMPVDMDQLMDHQVHKFWHDAVLEVGKDYELGLDSENRGALLYKRNGLDYVLIMDNQYYIESYQIGMKDFKNIRDLL